MAIRKGEYYQHPQDEWDEAKCKRESRKVWKDGYGTKIHFRGYLGSSATIGGYGKTRYNGGCEHNGDWWEGEIKPLPKVHQDYVIVVIPSWGWRLRHVNDTDTVGSERPISDRYLGQPLTPASKPSEQPVTTTEKLLNELNELRGLKYPQIGYAYFADIKGDGRNIKSVYTITNEAGGVQYSSLNGKSPRKRCENIRQAIADEKRKLTPA